MAKLTAREKKMRAKLKKELQEKGVIPPDKPRLNRKKFAQEVVKEFDELNDAMMYWYIREGISWMIAGHEDRPITPEQIGVLKVMKLATELKKYEKALPEGTTQYNLMDLYKEAVAPIMDL